jgi:hypothetical protein
VYSSRADDVVHSVVDGQVVVEDGVLAGLDVAALLAELRERAADLRRAAASDVQDENAVHPVDEWLPLRWSLPLGFQQLLAAYASIIIAPLVLASALGWPQEQTTYLLAAGLLGSGVATLIQCLGMPGLPVGTRLPVVQGTTVAVIPPLMAIGANGDLTAMFGGTIVAGMVCLLLAGQWSRLLRFFPPLVTGTVITVIGVSLMPVAVMWLSGGRGFGAQDTSTVELGLGLGHPAAGAAGHALRPRPARAHRHPRRPGGRQRCRRAAGHVRLQRCRQRQLG